ncbi:MAG: histidine phosphatase family protein [Aquabacterium sp.]
MGTLYLVRHGQASFGAADYDNLSDLGRRQCERLGAYLHERGHRFAATWTGTLRRQRQSLAAIGTALPGLPAVVEDAALNEYDSHAVLRATQPQPLAPATTPEGYRAHFRALREGLQAWMHGEVQPEGMPSFAAFQAGIAAVLEQALRWQDEDVLVVSSGGPISTALGLVLDLKAPQVIELNMRLRNSAICALATTRRRHALLTYNMLPHLDNPAHADWITAT